MAHTTRLRTFHLFAGAGGGILADLLLGHLPVGACEIEPYPRNVLLARQRDGILPEFPIWDDVKTLRLDEWKGRVEILEAGWPCQDISAMGRGAGICGERSGLWSEVKRKARELRPRFLFLENSPMLTSRGLGTVLGDLAELGYNARWGRLGTSDCGGDHQRKRLWIFAYPNRINVERGREQKVCRIGTLQRFGYDRSFKGRAERSMLYTPGLLRKGNEVANQVERSKAIGNGQDAVVAATAFSILSEGLI